MNIDKGYYNAMSISNHHIDELRSALQKFARLGMEKEMINVAYQMDSFKLLGPHRVTKAIRTNLINRLVVILFEDVSFREINTFIKCIQLIREWRINRDPFDTIANICSLICKSKKLREPMILFDQFGQTPDKQKAIDFITNTVNGEILNENIAFLYQNPQRAYNIMDAYKNSDEDLVDIIDFSLKEYKQKTRICDKSLFIVVPWLWVIHKNVLNWTRHLKPSTDYVISEQFELPDFIFDQHTKQGRKLGRGKEHFRAHGITVKNKDTFVWKILEN